MAMPDHSMGPLPDSNDPAALILYVGQLAASHNAVQNLLQRTQAEVGQLRAQVAALEAARPAGAEAGLGEKKLINLKSFQDVPQWSGKELEFGDFEFKLHQFVEPFTNFERFLDYIKDLDEEPTAGDIAALAREESAKDPKVDDNWMDSQLYSVLSMKLLLDPLQSLKGAKDKIGCRGSVAWHRVTREVAGKSGVRLERLSDKAHYQKKIESYADALQQLRSWEQDVKDLAKIEGQAMADLTKRTTLKRMIPADLVRDLERDKTLKTFTAA